MVASKSHLTSKLTGHVTLARFRFAPHFSKQYLARYLGVSNSASREDNLSMIVDKNNDEVKLGVRVRVLAIAPDLISTFSDAEAIIIKSMINKIFEVTELIYGKALVYQSFDKLNGFSLALDSAEMELVINE